MQHADRIDEIKGRRSEWRSMKIGLHHLSFANFTCIRVGNLNRRAEIDGPNLCAVFRRVVSEASIPTTCVQNFLAAKEFRRVRLHVIEKALLPFTIHLREALPLITKAQGRFRLSFIEI